MQSTEDRRRLMAQYEHERSRPLATVFKCLAGIAVLFIVAAGPWVVLSAGAGRTAPDSGEKAAAAFPSSIAESRRLYEERRQHVERRDEGTTAALAK